MDYSILENLEFAFELILAELLLCSAADRKKNFITKAALTILAVIGISLLIPYNRILAHGNTQFLFMKFALILAVSIAGMRISLKCSWEQAFLWGVGGYMLQNMAFSVSDSLEILFSAVFDYADDGTWHIILIRLIVFPVVYAITYFICIKRIRSASDGLELRKAAWLGAGMTFLVIILSGHGHRLTEGDRIWFRIMGILGCTLGFAIITILLDNRHLSVELETMKQKEALQENYYTFLKDNIESTNIRCHDVKHLILRIQQDIAKREPSSESVSALKEVEKAVNIYDAVAKTGNESVDTVLTEKSLICGRKNIYFTYMVDDKALKIFVPGDIYILFGNALDNAIEAVEQLEDLRKRVINLNAVCTGPFINIHLYNYCAEPPCMENGRIVTTKKDRRLHGYGIKSIRTVIEKYGGDLNISYENEIFCLNIVIPIIGSNR